MTPEQTQRLVARRAAELRRIKHALDRMESVLAYSRRGATVADMSAAQRLLGRRRWLALLNGHGKVSR